MAEMSPLRRRMIEDMTIRNLSPATQRSYIRAVSKFSRHFGRSPDRLGVGGRASLPGASGSKRGLGSLNQVVCALRFFYGVTLDGTILERIAYARAAAQAAGRAERRRSRAVSRSRSRPQVRAALTTAYAAGLRVSEVAALKVSDIDSQRMGMRVEHGKGGKERYAMLSAQLLGILRSYWRLARPPLSVSGPGPGQADRADGVARRLSFGAAAAGLDKRCACTFCATASPPIFWRAASTSASSRFCSVTRICRRRRAIRASPSA